MIMMTSSKATANPMMTLLSSCGRSDSKLSWEPWRRRSVREALGSVCPAPLPHHFRPAHTHQHHQPQLQQP